MFIQRMPVLTKLQIYYSATQNLHTILDAVKGMKDIALLLQLEEAGSFFSMLVSVQPTWEWMKTERYKHG